MRHLCKAREMEKKKKNCCSPFTKSLYILFTVWELVGISYLHHHKLKRFFSFLAVDPLSHWNATAKGYQHKTWWRLHTLNNVRKIFINGKVSSNFSSQLLIHFLSQFRYIFWKKLTGTTHRRICSLSYFRDIHFLKISLQRGYNTITGWKTCKHSVHSLQWIYSHGIFPVPWKFYCVYVARFW